MYNIQLATFCGLTFCFSLFLFAAHFAHVMARIINTATTMGTIIAGINVPHFEVLGAGVTWIGLMTYGRSVT